jgi:hypothetical protein
MPRDSATCTRARVADQQLAIDELMREDTLSSQQFKPPASGAEPLRTVCSPKPIAPVLVRDANRRLSSGAASSPYGLHRFGDLYGRQDPVISTHVVCLAAPDRRDDIGRRHQLRRRGSRGRRPAGDIRRCVHAGRPRCVSGAIRVSRASELRDGSKHEADLQHGVPEERRLSLLAGDRRFVQRSGAITVRATDLQGCLPLATALLRHRSDGCHEIAVPERIQLAPDLREARAGLRAQARKRAQSQELATFIAIQRLDRRTPLIGRVRPAAGRTRPGHPSRPPGARRKTAGGISYAMPLRAVREEFGCGQNDRQR